METLPTRLEEPPPRVLSAQDAARELPGLIEQAREASGEERSARVHRVNGHLAALATPEGSREAADVLLRLLEDGSLEGLEGPRGRTCRAVAVETLLRLGFPYALEVRPEDLEHLRSQGSKRQRRHIPLRPLAMGVVSAGLVGEWMAFMPWLHQGAHELPTVAFMGLRLLAAMAAAFKPDRSAIRFTGLWVLGLLSVFQVYLGLLGIVPMLIGGGAGLVAWLLLLLARR